MLETIPIWWGLYIVIWIESYKFITCLLSLYLQNISLLQLYLSFDGLQVPQNKYLSYLYSSSEGNARIEEDSETCSRSMKERQTRGQKIRRKFNKHMQFHLAQGGSFSYDDETKGGTKVPLRYTHLRKNGYPRNYLQLTLFLC